MDQSGQIRTNMDRIEPMWTECTEYNQSGLNKNYCTDLDRIEL